MSKNKKSLFSPRDVFGEPCASRRGFLSNAGKLALGTSAVMISGGLFPSNSFAAEKIGKDANVTLLKMARDVYPHDTLEDKYYVKVMSPMAKAAEKDSDLFTLLADGVKSLNKISVEKFSVQFIDIKTEKQRHTVLKALESTPFFQKIKGDLMMGIYNNPDLWPRFGFGGSAWEKGGYINRGYNDINWL